MKPQLTRRDLFWLMLVLCPTSVGTPSDSAEPDSLGPVRSATDSVLKSLDVVSDYECQLRRQERTSRGELRTETFFVRVRHHFEHQERPATPASVYLRSLGSKWEKDAEVLWVEGRDEDKLLLKCPPLPHSVPFPLWLTSTTRPALGGFRQPLNTIGMKDVATRFAKFMSEHSDAPDASASVTSMRFNGQHCTRLTFSVSDSSATDIRLMQLTIDDKRKLPVHFAAYSTTNAEATGLLEDYTWWDLKTDVGLDDSAFNEHNADYNFHWRDRVRTR